MRRDLYVIDRRRFTSAGGVASLDMMLRLISDDYGPNSQREWPNGMCTVRSGRVSTGE
jgi:transcriptional regulator GlxA family with amidase domain